MDRQLPLWRRARRRAYWLLLVGLLGMAARMPLKPGRALCRRLILLALDSRSRDRRRALANLEMALPHLDDWGRRELLTRSAGLLGENLFDALAAPRLLDRGLVLGPGDGSGEGPGQRPGENLEPGDLAAEVRRLLAQGRGLFILTGHLGCWELLGGWLGRFFLRQGLPPLGVVTGTLHNPAIDRLVQRRRRHLGLVPLPRSRGARPLLRHLQGPGAVAVLLDQNTRTDMVPVPFFGRPAPTPAGLARMALRFGVPVLPLGLARHGRGHRVVMLPALEPPPAAGPVSEEQVRQFTAACNGCLEEMIRRNPAEWVWFHDRWGLLQD